MTPREKKVGAGRAKGAPQGDEARRKERQLKVAKPVVVEPPGKPGGRSVRTGPGRPKPKVVRAPGKRTPGRLAEVVDEINGIYVRGALETALAVADVVVERILGGDESRLARGRKDPQLAELAAHEGLRVPPHTLWTALEVHQQMKVLAEDVAWQLSLSHHRVLLGVPNVRSKQLMAKRAVREDLNKRELQEAVTKWRARNKLPSLGRPPENRAVAASRRMATAALRLNQALEEEGAPVGNERRDVVRRLELTAKRLRRAQKSLGIIG